MTHKEFYENFSRHIEQERHNLGKTQKEMADLLDISLSTYKRIINNKCDHIDIYLSYKMFVVCQRLTYEMVDYTDKVVDAISLVKTLSPEQLEKITHLILSFKGKE